MKKLIKLLYIEILKTPGTGRGNDLELHFYLQLHLLLQLQLLLLLFTELVLSSKSQFGELKVGVNAQQDLGSLEGTNASQGKLKALKFAQGSPDCKGDTQLSGKHVPKD